MLKSLYTNTSSPKAIAGLLLVTLGVAYINANATEIVDSVVRVAKDVSYKAQEVAHQGKHQVSVIERTYDGRLHDTGKRIWIKK